MVCLESRFSSFSINLLLFFSFAGGEGAIDKKGQHRKVHQTGANENHKEMRRGGPEGGTEEERQ